MTHLYTVLVGATVLPGEGIEPAEAIAWAHDTVLALGTEAQVRGVSRGDSQVVALRGRFVVPLGGPLEVGGPADLQVLLEDPRLGADASRALAIVRAGRVVSGDLGLVHDHAPFAIRPATPDDSAAEAALEHGSAIHHATIDPDRWRVPSIDEVASSRRHWAAADPRSEAFLAVADGSVVGMLELWLRRPKDPGNAQIGRVRAQLSIVVAPESRGHGVGSALLREAEAWARAHGAQRMALGLDAANAGALRLYERFGYATWGLEMDKPIEPDPAAVDDASIIRNADGEVVPTLVGDRVSLRPLRPGDRPAITALLEDPAVAAVWDTRGAEHSADELLAGDSGLTVWAIEVDGVFAGSIQASEESDPDYRHAGIDIFLSSSFTDRGLGTDALRTLVRYLIDIRGHHRLTIDPAASNARAIRSYQKVGFRPVGVMRRYERGRDGTFHDGLLMDLLAEDAR